MIGLISNIGEDVGEELPLAGIVHHQQVKTGSKMINDSSWRRRAKEWHS